MQKLLSLKSDYVRYLAITEKSFKTLLVYRNVIPVTLFSNLVYLTANVFLWLAVYGSEDRIIDTYSLDDMIQYAIIAWLIFNFTESMIDRDLSKSIKTGNIQNDLVRPINYFLLNFFNSLGRNLFKILFVCLPVFVVSYIFFSNAIVRDLTTMVLFVISAVLGLIINFQINYSFGFLAVWTISSRGFIHFKDIFSKLLSGMFIPLVFFPKYVEILAEFLPFEKIVYYPTLIYLNGSKVALEVLTKQLLWVLILAILIKVVYKKGINKLLVQGG